MFCHWNEKLRVLFFQKYILLGVLLLLINTRKIMSNVFSAGFTSASKAQCSLWVFSGLISRI